MVCQWLLTLLLCAAPILLVTEGHTDNRERACGRVVRVRADHIKQRRVRGSTSWGGRADGRKEEDKKRGKNREIGSGGEELVPRGSDVQHVGN